MGLWRLVNRNKICSADQQTGRQIETILQMKSEGSWMENSQSGKIKLGSNKFFYGCI